MNRQLKHPSFWMGFTICALTVGAVVVALILVYYTGVDFR